MRDSIIDDYDPEDNPPEWYEEDVELFRRELFGLLGDDFDDEIDTMEGC